MRLHLEAEATLGPIPSAREFESYERILPGAAHRILVMAEKDGEHVRRADRRAAYFLLVERLFTRALGAAFAIAALWFAWDLAMNGHDWVAGIIAGTTIGGVVAALVLGKVPGNTAE